MPGWELIAYGADRWVTEHDVDLDGMPVDVRPPFPPDLTDKVLGAADVLVLPSLMPRVALGDDEGSARAGLAVVCSDSLGPEEVVVDSRNGLIVPTGDSEALAAAIARLAGDLALVERLKAEAPSVQLRSIDDQVDGLLTRYASLRSVATAAPSVGTRAVHRGHRRRAASLSSVVARRGAGAERHRVGGALVHRS